MPRFVTSPNCGFPDSAKVMHNLNSIIPKFLLRSASSCFRVLFSTITKMLYSAITASSNEAS
ncbi:hypothetical protein RMATCC62417_10859 [Rhizopus microsporus]|nr:hypothetical protein RMATCC62417_10859 [Rhizopus microsporus]